MVRENHHKDFKEDRDRDIPASEHKMEVKKMIKKVPYTLDVIHGNKKSKCCLEPCPCSNDFDLPSYVNFLSLNENLARHGVTSGEYEYSFCLNRFCRTVSMFNSPKNFSWSEYILKYLIYQRTTRRINDLADIVSGSLIDITGSVFISHSGKWKLDARVENTKPRAILRSPRLVQLGLTDDLVKQSREFSICRESEKSSESSSPTFWDGNISLRNFKHKIVSPWKRSSEMGVISYPSINSSFLCQFTSFADASTSKGQVQCFQKNGIPYFIFSVDDAPRLIYMANLQKIESSGEKTIDYIYSFHVSNDNKNESRKHILHPSGLIAKMKVSSSVILKPNRSKFMETVFVLYGFPEERTNLPQKSYPIFSTSKSLSRKVSGIFKPNTMSKNIYENVCSGAKLVGFADVNEFSLVDTAVNFVDDLPPNIELAAMVIEECLLDSTNELAVGGWGLKFLEKSCMSENDPPVEPSISQGFSDNLSSDGDESARSINVLIPAGFHGGPVTRIGGPSSLVNRWRSGGHCDCGGWDIGCPLRVMAYKSTYPKDSENNCKTVNLFTKGTRNGGSLTFSMTNLKQGTYSIYFQSSLSPLQSFSIAISIIHAEVPDLFPNI